MSDRERDPYKTWVISAVGHKQGESISVATADRVTPEFIKTAETGTWAAIIEGLAASLHKRGFDDSDITYSMRPLVWVRHPWRNTV